MENKAPVKEDAGKDPVRDSSLPGQPSGPPAPKGQPTKDPDFELAETPPPPAPESDAEKKQRLHGGELTVQSDPISELKAGGQRIGPVPTKAPETSEERIADALESIYHSL